MSRVAIVLAATILIAAAPAAAQQRPLVTEDPEPIGAGMILFEGGFDYENEAVYPASGLTGNLMRIPTVGMSFGLSSIAEFQIDWSVINHLSVTDRVPAPLSSLLDFTGATTSDVGDIVLGTKIRIAAEGPGHPAFGVRFATKLPNASNESGLGLDTTDFFASMLIGKTIKSLRVVGNFGFAILGEPTQANSQNDVIIYGISAARAVTNEVEVVGELNGRWSTREGDPPAGTESRAATRIGFRYTKGAGRVDAGVILGMTDVDPFFGITAGFTYVFRAFRVP